MLTIENGNAKNGEGGHRSHCLSHAKRALYHLSYIPYMDISEFHFHFEIEECKAVLA